MELMFDEKLAVRRIYDFEKKSSFFTPKMTRAEFVKFVGKKRLEAHFSDMSVTDVANELIRHC